MGTTKGSVDALVATLMPSLARSLAEQFNVFRVMHHGTHEKQLSNVFAWLLDAEGSHELGDRFPQLFVDAVNRELPPEARVGQSAFSVRQEVDTSDPSQPGRDIADIVLTGRDTTLVVENFESSDGHGHNYWQYRAFGEVDGRNSLVVLLCERREPHRQTEGWENAAVVTYAELLESLRGLVERDRRWRISHPRQHGFLSEAFDYFIEGAPTMDDQERVEFIKVMCDTGEAARYGHRPQDVAAETFANQVAEHAKQQFEEGREALGQAKRDLRRFAEQVLKPQLNSVLEAGKIGKINAPFVGRWEWCVMMKRTDEQPEVFLEFGPSAVVANGRVPVPLPRLDYSKVFVTRRVGKEGIDLILQTEVGLDEVLAGLNSDDTRLRDAILAAIRA